MDLANPSGVILDNPAGVAAPYGDRFAHVSRIDIGDTALLFLAGQAALDEQGAVVGAGDIVAQSERIFEIIGGILAAHGASFDDVMHLRVYLTSIDDLPGYGSVRRRIFTRTPPASTAVQVSRLFLPEALIEVEVTAVSRRSGGPR